MGIDEADFYENFNNDGEVTHNTHEFATCLETDKEGNFYYLRGDSGGASRQDGSLLRVSRDGAKLDVVATGLRNGNGLAIGPQGMITVSPQEGNWTPGLVDLRGARGRVLWNDGRASSCRKADHFRPAAVLDSAGDRQFVGRTSLGDRCALGDRCRIICCISRSAAPA